MANFAIRLAVLAVGFASSSTANELYRTSLMPAKDTVPVSNFSYIGLTGPLNWYGLNESANGLCDMGATQSPINIDETVAVTPGSAITFSIPDVEEALFENLGTNVEVVVNGTLVDEYKTYKLAQFHYHSPSEHRINGEYFPIGMHWVFETEGDASIAVVAFLLELDDGTFIGPLQHEVLDSVTEIPNPGDSTMLGPLEFAYITEHLNQNNVYRYNGSLTTPPCSESVDWIISQAPLMIDVNTYLASKKVLKFNSRYTQDSLGTVNLLENAAQELAGT